MRPDLAEAAFQIADVSKRYGPRWALARLTFSLERGKSLLLTGHNGSGKSTLLKLLGTATAPTFGKLTLFGLDAVSDREAIRRRVALLSHASYLYEDLTAEQNLVVLGRLLGVADPPAAARAVIERVGMTKRADHAVRTFSAGMRKRIAIARLLLKKPDLALLDEPFGELDPEGIAVMEGFIRELRAGGTTVVLATHLIEQGQSLTDTRLHLAEGRTLEAA
ncbi:MAG: ABC transporter ATP-binding protein [Myxococcaceae bacterium]|nr:ABC transporter ATP-binding protein [Myxococcaceae bacterium]